MKERSKIIDSLKGISILGIVLVHSPATGDIPTFARQIKNMGATGTVVFMLISVLLMLSSYERRVIGGNEKTINWFISRLLRILPMYYFFLVLRLVILTRGRIDYKMSVNAIMHFLFINSLFPTYANSILGVEWFVGAIVFFYIITPLIYRIFNSVVKTIWGLLISSSVAICVNHVCVIHLFSIVEEENRYSYDAWIGGWFPPLLLDIYFAGMILFFLSKKKEMILEMEVQTRRALSFSLMALFAILFLAYTIGELRIWGINSRVICAFIYSILIIALHIYPNKLLVNGVFAFLGKYTYGIFLSNFIIISLISRIPIHYENSIVEWLASFFAALLVGITVSIALTEAFERPFLRLLKK